MKHQVLIASYAKDFPWLIHCLASLKKFSSGFLHPVVVTTFDDWAGARAIADQSYPEVEVKVYDGAAGQGFMRAQTVMCAGDIFCPEADHTWLLGSDCVVTAPFRPEPYFEDGKPVMLYSQYAEIEKHHPQAMPWRAGTTRAIGRQPEHEFMRRLPLIYPKGLFAPMRRHIESRHSCTFQKYMALRGAAHPFDSSESNWLGAFAWDFMPHVYTWAEITDWEMISKKYPNVVLQLWSHGGLDGKCDHGFILPSGRNTAGLTPRSIINEVVYGISS